jgi:hypothetical protein
MALCAHGAKSRKGEGCPSLVHCVWVSCIAYASRVADCTPGAATPRKDSCTTGAGLAGFGLWVPSTHGLGCDTTRQAEMAALVTVSGLGSLAK